MRCRQFRASHLHFVDGHLAPGKAEAMWNHLEVCATCAQFDATVRRSLLVARNLPTVRVSAGFHSRLRAQLRNTIAEAPLMAASRIATGLRYGAAAAVVLIGAIVLWSQHGLSSTTPSAQTVAAAVQREPGNPETARIPQQIPAPSTPTEIHVSAQFAAGLATGVAVWPGVLMADRTAREMGQASSTARTAP